MGRGVLGAKLDALSLIFKTHRVEGATLARCPLPHKQTSKQESKQTNKLKENTGAVTQGTRNLPNMQGFLTPSSVPCKPGMLAPERWRQEDENSGSLLAT